ncbi:MAG TPA: methyl-accepting chemotaxis protein [Nitrospirota bacterium]|nr:methyl-accepting chemotaxis protein [Nitrospirota bacterium]
MTIKYKFKAVGWLIGVVLFAVTFISLLTNIFLVNANKEIYEESTRGIEDISVIQNLLNDARNKEVLAVSYAAVANMDKLANLEKEISHQRGVLVEKLFDVNIDAKSKNDIKSLITNYFESAALTFEHAKHYVTDEAARNITENSRVPFDKLEEQFDRFMNAKVKLAADQNKKAITFAMVSRVLLLLAMLTAAGLIVFLVFFSRSILQPINTMFRFVRGIAEGDVSNTIKIDSKDELGVMGSALMDMSSYLRDMARTAEAIAEGDLRTGVMPKSEKDVLGSSFQKMVIGLRGLIAEIRGGAERLAAASTQIAASADQTSKNSETSASAVEEMTATMHEMSANMQNVATNTQKQAVTVTSTSSSIEQMVASIQLVAEHVRHLVTIAEKSKDAVAGGAAAVDQASQGMSGIHAAIQQSAETITSLGSKTEDMSKIVEVIDDIAEQTNLLALNAAIEAAKAGDQGLGFAVVAEEVRKLAERSAQSTREIADLIKSIAKEAQSSVDTMTKSTGLVQEGLRFSKEVTRALEGIQSAVEDLSRYSKEIGAATQEQSIGSEQIRKAVSNLNEIILEISSASEQQSMGSGQVVQAIERVKDMVQQGSSSAVELAASADQLSRQASSLQTLVERFALNGNGKAYRDREPLTRAV